MLFDHASRRRPTETVSYIRRTFVFVLSFCPPPATPASRRGCPLEALQPPPGGEQDEHDASVRIRTSLNLLVSMNSASAGPRHPRPG